MGQKKALEFVRKYKQPAIIFSKFENLGFDWQEIFKMFRKPEIDIISEIEFPKLDKKAIKRILLEHDFSEERIDNQLEKLEKSKDEAAQKTLF